MASKKRDHLVDTALGLFCRYGFRATGIDRILAEAGVAKMTLYKHFRSKEDLVVAALERRDRRFREWLADEVRGRGRTPAERLLAVFDAVETWCGGTDFHGCSFINASAEYHEHDDPVHAVAAAHKRWMSGFLRDLAAAAGASAPEELAGQLVMLLDGALVAAHVTGDAGPAAQRARRAAECLVAAAGVTACR